MSKRGPTRPLSQGELLSLQDENLTTLQKLAEIYDGGYPPIVFAMATEALKLLTENKASMKARASVRFPSYLRPGEERSLSAIHRLTGVQLGGEPPKLTFVPIFWFGEGHVLSGPRVEFKVWWNREPIYRASAAIPGGPPGQIPVNGSPSVPFVNRLTVSRFTLIHMLRNKQGAHQASELPVLLDELDHTSNWADFGVEMPDGSALTTWEGTLPIVAGPVAAMMRQITHEILEAYGRDDPRPAAQAP